jgi:uncharacterized protein (DUF488 family)
MSEVFTVGHSNQPVEGLVRLLELHRITAIADVRSSPYSRYAPQFNREALRPVLAVNGIQYVYLGAELGARRTEPACYEGRTARYPLIARSPLFQTGLTRVRNGATTHRIALMCAEKDPLVCHRSILICRHLRTDLTIAHILEDGTLEPHAHLESRLLELVGLPPGDLFHSRAELVEQAYDLRGERMAYTEPEPGSEEDEEGP